MRSFRTKYAEMSVCSQIQICQNETIGFFEKDGFAYGGYGVKLL